MIVYTVYWEDKLSEVRKEHGTFETEEEARQGIQAWWDLQHDHYKPTEEITNTGALEITYTDDPNYVYRIEKREVDHFKAHTSYQLKSKEELSALHKKLLIDDEYYFFDELAEPYRDRLIQAINDIDQARKFIYSEKGELIREI